MYAMQECFKIIVLLNYHINIIVLLSIATECIFTVNLFTPENIKVYKINFFHFHIFI